MAYVLTARSTGLVGLAAAASPPPPTKEEAFDFVGRLFRNMRELQDRSNKLLVDATSLFGLAKKYNNARAMQAAQDAVKLARKGQEELAYRKTQLLSITAVDIPLLTKLPGLPGLKDVTDAVRAHILEKFKQYGIEHEGFAGLSGWQVAMAAVLPLLKPLIYMAIVIVVGYAAIKTMETLNALLGNRQADIAATYAEMIADVQKDPTLTPEQKVARTEALRKSQEEALKRTKSWYAELKWPLIIAGGAILAVNLVPLIRLRRP